jgi:hypothetical protein
LQTINRILTDINAFEFDDFLQIGREEKGLAHPSCL